ncbi:MAG: GAF domain-containing protein [Treponema sp.]|jgi:GAF domain-containing protein|nr:GAF domain-containing protein [Treponema sp.]
MTTLEKEKDAEANLALMVQTAQGFIRDETYLVTVLANISALIYSCLDDVNWAGFYILKGKELVLGPFQGLPACTRIGEGKGVCGKAVQEKRPLIVSNVHEFPGHIACDSASASEIVIPIFKNSAVYGVLDVDSPRLNRFSVLEEKYLNEICGGLSGFLERPGNRMDAAMLLQPGPPAIPARNIVP